MPGTKLIHLFQYCSGEDLRTDSCCLRRKSSWSGRIKQPKRPAKRDLVYIRYMITAPGAPCRRNYKPNPAQRRIWFTFDLDPDSRRLLTAGGNHNQPSKLQIYTWISPVAMCFSPHDRLFTQMGSQNQALSLTKWIIIRICFNCISMVKNVAYTKFVRNCNY